jgi:hypothetical protein
VAKNLHFFSSLCKKLNNFNAPECGIIIAGILLSLAEGGNFMPEFKIHLRKSRDYKIVPATGASGGVSPQGEIIIDFFLERLEAESVTLEQEESGGEIKELKREGEKITRETQMGVVLRPDIAHNIGKFLISQAKKAGYIEEMEKVKGNA